MNIAQITDLHLDDFLAQKFGVDTCSHFERILSEVRARGITQIILTGDLGIPERHRWLVDQLNANDLRFDVILGNHDSIAPCRASGLLTRETEPRDEYYYAETRVGKRLIFLDTGRGSVSEAQRAWLAAELATSAEEILVFAHHPLLDCGTAMDRSMALSGRDSLAALMEACDKPVQVFCGHYHCNDERVGRVSQYVTPATIMQIRSEGDSIVTDSFDFGFRILNLIPGRTTNEVVMVHSGRTVEDQAAVPRLVRFDAIEEAEYEAYMAEWEATGEKIVPMSSSRKGRSFVQMQQKWTEGESEAAYQTGFVPSTTYFLVEATGRILGSLSWRPVLNQNLLVNGGNLGYGVRPSERRKGHAAGMVRRLLDQIVETGPVRVLVTCDEDNLASRRTIEACGGVLENQLLYEGVWTRRYWIPVALKAGLR